MSLYEIILVGNLVDDPSNEFVNVFGYDGTPNVTVASDWNLAAEQWADDILSKITPLVASTMQYTRLSIRGLTDDPIAFDHIFLPPILGLSGGDPLPKFNAWGFQYIRGAVGQRSGAKRFGPPTENLVTAGVATPAALVALNTLAATLADTWIISSLSGSLEPVIISHVGGAHGNSIAGVQYKRVTTQNSRKR